MHFTYLGKTGFDTDTYIDEQSRAITDRTSKFHKLYLETGGKLLYDYHAARVLPGYDLDCKMRVLEAIKKHVEFVVCVSAKALGSGKRMGSLGISYRDFTLKMIDAIEDYGFPVSAVVITLYSGEKPAKELGRFLDREGYNVYLRRFITGYPTDLNNVIKEFARRPHIKTKKRVVVVTGAGPGSGKMSTCLTMVYQDKLHKKDSGYAKFETFPVWNLPLKSPINYAYEAATADIGDYNVIDPYHYRAYGVRAVNYNRDVESFLIIQKVIKKVISKDNFMLNYKSPTDMGINMIKKAITDLDLCERAARQEIVRRYFEYKVAETVGRGDSLPVKRVLRIMRKLKISFDERPVIRAARQAAEKQPYKNLPLRVGAAIMVHDGTVLTAHNSPAMHAEPGAVIRALKYLAGLPVDEDVISPTVINQIKKLKRIYGDEHENLNLPETLLSLAISAYRNSNAKKAFEKLPLLRSCELHTTHLLGYEDKSVLRKLGIHATSDGRLEVGKLVEV